MSYLHPKHTAESESDWTERGGRREGGRGLGSEKIKKEGGWKEEEVTYHRLMQAQLTPSKTPNAVCENEDTAVHFDLSQTHVRLRATTSVT